MEFLFGGLQKSGMHVKMASLHVSGDAAFQLQTLNLAMEINPYFCEPGRHAYANDACSLSAFADLILIVMVNYIL